MKHFLANEWHRTKALKRGGQVRFIEWDALDPEGRYAGTSKERGNPEQLFDCEWAMEIVARSLRALRNEMYEKGKGDRFDLLKGYLSGAEGLPRKEIAARLGISEGAVKVAIHRLRQRYRQLLQGAIAETVNSEEDLQDEMRYLVTVLRSQ
jgi:RNA polymerase sigma-70 factor (ECF subfamily)